MTHLNNFFEETSIFSCFWKFFFVFFRFFRSQKPAKLLKGLVIGYFLASSGNRMVLLVLTSRTLAIFLMELGIFFQIYQIYCLCLSFPRGRKSPIAFDNRVLKIFIGHRMVFHYFIITNFGKILIKLSIFFSILLKFFIFFRFFEPQGQRTSCRV